MKTSINALSKKETEEYIKKTLEENPPKESLKNLKKLAMTRNIKLKELRKKFCKNCYSLYNSDNTIIRIKMPLKQIICKNCRQIARYKIK